MMRSNIGSLNAAYLVGATPRDYSDYDVPGAIARLAKAVADGKRSMPLFGGVLHFSVVNFSTIVYECAAVESGNYKVTSVSKDGRSYSTKTRSVSKPVGTLMVTGLSSAAGHILHAGLLKALPSMRQEHVAQHSMEATGNLRSGLRTCFPQRMFELASDGVFLWAPRLVGNVEEITREFPVLVRDRIDRIGAEEGIPDSYSLYTFLRDDGNVDLINPNSTRCYKLLDPGSVSVDAPRVSRALAMIVEDYSSFQKCIGSVSAMTRSNIVAHAHDVGQMMDKAGRPTMPINGTSAFAGMSIDEVKSLCSALSGDTGLVDPDHEWRMVNPIDWPDGELDGSWSNSSIPRLIRETRDDLKDMRMTFMGLAQVKTFNSSSLPKWSVLWGTAAMPGWHHPNYLVVSRV